MCSRCVSLYHFGICRSILNYLEALFLGECLCIQHHHATCIESLPGNMFTKQIVATQQYKFLHVLDNLPQKLNLEFSVLDL